MKQLKSSFKIVFAIWIVLFFMSPNANAQTAGSEQNDVQAPLSALQQMDSVEVSLLTVGPGNEVWSVYGHTALRYQNHLRKQDLAINYGAFNFEQDYFILRFVFGATDYEMETLPMSLFMTVYREEQRWVVEQQLNLTREEKLAITQALYENSLPENVSYRYNFFYNNCTTRARDMIINHLNCIGYQSDTQWNGESYREMTHQWTRHHRWTRFGNDLLLGIGSDFKTEREASFFLPDSVRKDFSHIIITNPDGSKRKLVSKTEWLNRTLKKTLDFSPFSFLTPQVVFAMMFAVVLLLTIYQWRSKRNLWWLDMLLLLTSGIAGIILLLMVFSQHPTVRVNLQILLLNPLSLLFLYPTVRAGRKGHAHWYWTVLAGCILLFFIGAIWQTYAEGMYFVALCLLIRCIVNIRHEK